MSTDIYECSECGKILYDIAGDIARHQIEKHDGEAIILVGPLN